MCPVEVLCESDCVLSHEGRRPIAIAALQRYATDHAFEYGFRLRPAPRRQRSEHVAVIGAGPAGLVCAGELAALGYRVTVYDGRSEVGGLVRYGIAPYRQRSEPLSEEARLLEQLGVSFRLEEPIDSPDALRRIEDGADAVFLGVGLGKDVDADLPGSDLPGVWHSLEFVEALKTGRPPAVGRQTIVIGGGNTAVDVAREALRLGSAVVTLAYRRTEAEMPAFRHEVEEARAEGVDFHWLAAPTRFVGEHHLTGVECSLMQLGRPTRAAGAGRSLWPEASSCFRPTPPWSRSGSSRAATCSAGSKASSWSAAGSRSIPRQAGRAIRSTTQAGTPSTAARRSSRPSHTRSSQPARSTPVRDRR